VNPRERVGPRRRESAHALHAAGTPLETYASGRRCAVEDCNARLSRYNPSDTCSIHRGWADTRVRAPYGG
jgi:hypothetical protein